VSIVTWYTLNERCNLISDEVNLVFKICLVGEKTSTHHIVRIFIGNPRTAAARASGESNGRAIVVNADLTEQSDRRGERECRGGHFLRQKQKIYKDIHRVGFQFYSLEGALEPLGPHPLKKLLFCTDLAIHQAIITKVESDPSKARGFGEPPLPFNPGFLAARPIVSADDAIETLTTDFGIHQRSLESIGHGRFRDRRRKSRRYWFCFCFCFCRNGCRRRRGWLYRMKNANQGLHIALFGLCKSTKEVSKLLACKTGFKRNIDFKRRHWNEKKGV
jgi:hypothetical protein